MELLGQGLLKAFELVAGFDREIWAITWLSLKISATATGIALLLGMPLGVLLALKRFYRPRHGRGAGQYRHGLAARGRRVVYLVATLAQRTVGISRMDLHADGDGVRPRW